MKNTMMDLNDHLFARLERLGDDDLEGDELKAEIQRSEATVKVAGAVVDNARVALDAVKFMAEQGVIVDKSDLPMITSRHENGILKKNA